MENDIFDSEGSLIVDVNEAIKLIEEYKNISLSKRQMQSLLHAGKIKGYKSGKKWFCKREYILEYSPKICNKVKKNKMALFVNSLKFRGNINEKQN